MDELEKQRLKDQTRIQTTEFVKTGFGIWLKVMAIIILIAVVGLSACGLMVMNSINHLAR